MPRAARKAQMLAVAEEVFAERGYVAASMDEIAERVGVSKPMLYEYFGSKEGLLVGCIDKARTELREATEQAVIGADSPEAMLRLGLLAFFRFIDERRQSYGLLRHEAAVTVPSAVEEIEAIRRQQTDLMIGWMALSLPGADPIELEAAAEILVGSCERLAQWCERRPEVTPERATDLLMTAVWTGLSSRAGD
ncbi:TetR/AcrR family transcriptional regulator [Kutzneria sp. NPDC052558]|uniref:TetR/AcrR family transcriptional regulator n=1 Tax=Kutzneria sp. NPDC052558 TaxID=3364121 RepID=UPI0037C7DB72